MAARFALLCQTKARKLTSMGLECKRRSSKKCSFVIVDVVFISKHVRSFYWQLSGAAWSSQRCQSLNKTKEMPWDIWWKLMKYAYQSGFVGICLGLLELLDPWWCFLWDISPPPVCFKRSRPVMDKFTLSISETISVSDALVTLWLCQNNYGKSPCLMGKLTISTGSFSIAILT